MLNDMQMLDPKDASGGASGPASSKSDEWGDVTPDDIPF